MPEEASQRKLTTHTHKHTNTSLLQIRNDLADLCADSLLKKTSKQAATH